MREKGLRIQKEKNRRKKKALGGEQAFLWLPIASLRAEHGMVYVYKQALLTCCSAAQAGEQACSWETCSPWSKTRSVRPPKPDAPDIDREKQERGREREVKKCRMILEGWGGEGEGGRAHEKSDFLFSSPFF